MNKQYSFKGSEGQMSGFTIQKNWTDQRVMQIMKKYEKPSRASNTPLCQPAIPLKTNSSYDHSPYMKEDRQPRYQTPLGDHNTNIDKSHRYQDTSYKKWRGEERPQKGDQNYLQSISKSIDMVTPQRFSQNYGFRDESTRVKASNIFQPQKKTPDSKWQKRTPTQEYSRDYCPQQSSILRDRQQFQFSDLNEDTCYKYSEKKKQQERDDRARFTYQRNHFEQEYSRKTIDLKEQKYDFTPTKKYENRVATEYCQNASREKSYKKDRSISHSKNKYESIDCDTRISNIDKINDKIKRILQKCSAPRQSSEVKLENKYKLNLTPQKYNYSQETKNNLEISLSSIGLKNNQEKSSSKNERCLTREKEQHQRSKSYLKDKTRTPKRFEEDDDKFSKIQEKINKFNDRVSYLAEEKKKLNIDFKLNKPESSTVKREEVNLSTISKQSKPMNKLPEVEIVESHRNDRAQSNNDEEFYKEPEENEAEEQQNFKMNEKNSAYLRNTENMKAEYQYPQTPDSGCQKQEEEEEEEDFDYYPNAREQQSFASVGNVWTKKFVQLLSEQVQLDEQFRLTKNWFVNSEISGQYEVLQSILEQRWREMPLSEIQADFSVNFQEDDPFYSYRPDQFVLEDVVNNYIICNKNWKQKIEYQFNIDQLEQEGLIGKLDMDGKGHIAIEDLVRIINMEEGTFFRNRDLYLIYQRMSKGSEVLNIEDFLNILSSQ